MRHGRQILLVILALWFTGMGFLGGILAERWRFDGRREIVLRGYQEQVTRLKARLMDLERLR